MVMMDIAISGTSPALLVQLCSTEYAGIFSFLQFVVYLKRHFPSCSVVLQNLKLQSQLNKKALKSRSVVLCSCYSSICFLCSWRLCWHCNLIIWISSLCSSYVVAFPHVCFSDSSPLASEFCASHCCLFTEPLGTLISQLTFRIPVPILSEASLSSWHWK